MSYSEVTLDPTLRCTTTEVKSYVSLVATRLGAHSVRALTHGNNRVGGVGRITILFEDEADGDKLRALLDALADKFMP